SGDLKRNTELLLTFSLGPKGSLQPVELIDFTNQSVREASNWLKRYGIGYSITYDFSKDVARGHIISQSIAAKQSVDPYHDKLTLVVSKGVEVVIPDFATMSKDDILRWAIDAKVNVSFSDAYDDTQPEGKVISANVKKDDKVEEGATIKVVLSKGPIVMEDFANYAAFKKWASQYNINYNEVVEYSTSVAKGEAIRYSVAAGTVLKNNQGITVTLSQGAPVVIPNFIGKSKSAIASQCNSIGLACSFVYGGYNSAAKDTAIAQNKTAGASVVSGTGVTITLSSGPAQSYTLVIQESWLQIGSASGTIASLRNQFASRYPGVSFQFVTRSHNSLNAGLIHPDSPTKTGATLSQGKTYTIYIVG
ncbi:MAG: PASTA domain-containing protein, partial [Erysipelotrichaceae bacterium]